MLVFIMGEFVAGRLSDLTAYGQYVRKRAEGQFAHPPLAAQCSNAAASSLTLRSAQLDRQIDFKLATFSPLRLKSDFAVHEVRQMAGDHQAQTDAAT
jgi:hypothetical protein